MHVSYSRAPQVTDLIFDKTKSITEIRSAEDFPSIDISTIGTQTVPRSHTLSACIVSHQMNKGGEREKGRDPDGISDRHT